MRYANGDDHPHHQSSKQLYVVLPLELFDHIQGSDKVW
jgi:hypothetical protein